MEKKCEYCGNKLTLKKSCEKIYSNRRFCSNNCSKKNNYRKDIENQENICVNI